MNTCDYELTVFFPKKSSVLVQSLTYLSLKIKSNTNEAVSFLMLKSIGSGAQ
jgi:hypothetical protein